MQSFMTYFDSRATNVITHTVIRHFNDVVNAEHLIQGDRVSGLTLHTMSSCTVSVFVCELMHTAMLLESDKLYKSRLKCTRGVTQNCEQMQKTSLATRSIGLRGFTQCSELYLNGMESVKVILQLKPKFNHF